MPSTESLGAGTRYGRLIVLGDGEPLIRKNGKRERRVLARCDCGIEKSYLPYALKAGGVKSCGCYMADVARDGLARFREKSTPPQEWHIDGDDIWIDINGERVFASAADFKIVGGIRWSINGNGYVESGRGTKRKTIHRLVAGLLNGDARLVDHRDQDTLNNRRSNLRIASSHQNQQNARKKSCSKNNFKGITKKRGKFDAAIRASGRQKWLGRFNSDVEAAKAYDRAAIKTFGEFACLNFPAEAGREQSCLLR